MMDACHRFETIQLAALLGDASNADLRWADGHTQRCQICCDTAQRDRFLEAAFSRDREKVQEGFSRAHRQLDTIFRDRRAYCRRIEGPFGPLFLARTQRGLCRVSFRRSEEEFMAELERRQLLPEFAPSKLSREANQLQEYFSGKCTRFRFPLDLRLVTPFQKSVLEAAAGVPFGQLVSYSELAGRIGKPEARRAVGGALGKNPIAIVIPCHRVIAADGTLGGYTGGLDIKRKLMEIEGIDLPEETTN